MNQLMGIISENSWEILFEFTKILAVFLLGLFSSFLINRRIINKKLRRIREFYISWINFSLESVDRQVVLFSKQIKDLSESKSPKFLFNNNQLHRLDSINNEELFDAFVLNNKGKSKDNSKNLHRLVSHIDFLLLSIREVKEKFFDIRDKKDVWNEKWNHEFLLFHNTVDEFININSNSESKYVAQIKELNDNFHKFILIESEPSDSFIRNYVHPVTSIFWHQNGLEASSYRGKVIGISKSLDLLFSERQELYLSYKRYLEHYESELESAIKKIKEIVNYFEEQE